ncbi:MAG: phosphoribosylformylglycinamidine synthase subunit PurQ [Candidatus Altiarchaeota archaeon]
MKACVMFIEGTNCEDDAIRAFKAVGIEAEKVHLKQLSGNCVRERRRTLSDYDILFIPGGWSAGDYIRAGAIFAARLKSRLGGELNDFMREGKPIIGVCNGFQILVEIGLLPGFNGMSEYPEAVLAINADGRFQCRPSYIRHDSRCKITEGISEGTIMQVPVAHAEGRLTFGDRNEEVLARLRRNKQIVFTYCHPDGRAAEGVFPWNPNGALADIAGICNPEGNVLGMMPHPERVVEKTQQADWTRKEYKEGEGLKFFKSIADRK